MADRNRSFATAAAPLLLAALMAGCVAGPDYHEPDIAVPAQFAGAQAPRYSREEADLAAFWTVFDDATLSRLVQQSLLANHDLRIALARLNEARALRGVARLDLAPVTTAGGGYTDQRLAAAAAAGGIREFEGYDAGFDAFWELDFFGRHRRALQAANAELGAAEATLLDTQVSVAAELTRSYFELRGYQQRLEVARRNVANQGQTLELTRARLEAGTGTELDTARAQAQLAATRALIAPFEAAVARSIHRISVLTGREPSALAQELASVRELPAVPEFTRVSDPAMLLRRRPDIRISERRLAAATAHIGVAVADLFPRVTFTGSLGYAAADIDALGDAGTGTHLIAPGISWAAFDLGRVRARIAAARARGEAALAEYEQTVLRALQEAEDALVTHARSRERLVQLVEAAEASGTAARLARLRYENGVVDFLQVLDAERSLLEAEDSLAQGRTEAATSLVALYKALGGGWVATNGG